MSRLRIRRRPPDGQPNEHYSTFETSHDGALIALTALKESADAFPPLKSAVGGVLHIWELCEKVKSNRRECGALASRAKDVLNAIADAVPDATQLPPNLAIRIDDFTRTLDDIQVFMEKLRRQKFLTRLVGHKRVEGSLAEFQQRLDDAFRSFITFSAISTGISVANIDGSVSRIGMSVTRVEDHGEAQRNRLDALCESLTRLDALSESLGRLDALSESIESVKRGQKDTVTLVHQKDTRLHLALVVLFD